jgi:predicted hotdog family 3-hydroxylacyl-ACP dehydratase
MDYTKPTDKFVSEIDIHELLPQKEPFVLVDGITHFDVRQIVTTMRVRAGKPFVEDGRLTMLGMLENMAQTCAARIGYINKYILRKDVRPGMIASVKSMEALAMPGVGTQIETTVTVKEEVFDMLLLTAEIRESLCTGSGCEPAVYAVAELKMKG